MALTDQPYLPLYVDDWMNNNKLKLCSPGAHGLMISIMCLMHKTNTYGKLLLNQKIKQQAETLVQQNGKQVVDDLVYQNEKQTSSHTYFFATQIARQTSFELKDVLIYLVELLDEEVLVIDGDYLISKRMVEDAKLSIIRSHSGKMGGFHSHK